MIQGTGIDPILDHAFPPKPLRHKTAEPTAAPASAPSSLKSKKRPVDGSYTADQPATKKSKANSVPLHLLNTQASAQVVGSEGGGSSMPKPEIQNQVNLAMQVCRYLLEMFSIPLLRSHATVSLVDRDRLQLYHANRSVILVSSAIDFSKDEGLDKFIAIIIAFHCLSPKQNGILNSLIKENSELVKNPGIPEDNKVVQRGNQLELPVDGSQEKIVVTLGNVISRDPATVGRSTVVLEATSTQWSESELVVKVSWPGSGRVRENDFLKKAEEEAEKSDGKWALEHLPRVFHAVDIDFDENSTPKLVARLFKDAKFVDGKYVYERRTLRIIIQERLYPLKSLTNVRDIGQVFLDVACSTYPFCFLITNRLPNFSSPLALRYPWDPPSRPEPQQYHVPTGNGESIRGSDRLRPFVVEEGPENHSAVYGMGVVERGEEHSLVSA